MRIRNTGLLAHDRQCATPGFTVYSPIFGQETYILGMEGQILHTWNHPYHPGKYAYLLENGNLLWAGETPEGPQGMGGKGGLLREYDWNGKIVWEHHDDAQHHDFRRTKNNTTLYLGWEPIPEEAKARIIGSVPGSEDNGIIWGDYIREVGQDGRSVWEWHIYEHVPLEDFPLHPMSERKEFAHCNSVQELPDGNLLLSFRKISTIMIIERLSGRLLWHKRDDSWGQQHDAQRLANGNILLFANGIHTYKGVPFSEIVEIDPKSGETVWRYRGSPTYSFFSPHISGVQRLWSGNTLICEGVSGWIFEVTPGGEIVWEFVNPRFAHGMGGLSNSVFRAYRYQWDSPQIRGRLGRP